MARALSRALGPLGSAVASRCSSRVYTTGMGGLMALPCVAPWAVRRGILNAPMVANVPLGFARRVFTRLLFPSPAGYPRRVRNDERILGLRATDGAIVHAVEVVGAAVPDTAPVLLFFHGNADTAFADVPLARSFAERGVRTFAWPGRVKRACTPTRMRCSRTSKRASPWPRSCCGGDR
jgi:hypothetical protein